jgi:hypothetical protein
VGSSKIGNTWYFTLSAVSPASKTARFKTAKTAKTAIKTAKPRSTWRKKEAVLTTVPDREAMKSPASEANGLAGNQFQANASAPEPTAQPEPELMAELEPEPTVEPPPTSEPSRQPAPADSLYALVRARGKIANRPVMTPQGPGKLWQVFYDRAGVLLDGAPGRVAFFDPSEVQVTAVH